VAQGEARLRVFGAAARHNTGQQQPSMSATMPKPLRSILMALACASLAAAQYQPHSGPGPHEVEVELGEWVDDSRDGRAVPWKLYAPADAERPLPVVVFSHGLGGSREGAEHIGRHLASHGYAALHIQHHGSDSAVLKDGVQAALRNAQNNQRAALDRFRDVPFVVDRIEAAGERFDARRIGISGHSYGAITTLVAAGQSNRLMRQRLAEPRFKAALAFSPSPPRNGDPEEAFAKMLMPIFHVTGTDDGDPLGAMQPEDRQQPFRIIDSVEQCLLVLDDAVHMTFSGRDAGYPKLARHHDLVKMAGLAYWDAYLRGDDDAKEWLASGGFANELGEDGVFKTKSPR